MCLVQYAITMLVENRHSIGDHFANGIHSNCVHQPGAIHTVRQMLLFTCCEYGALSGNKPSPTLIGIVRIFIIQIVMQMITQHSVIVITLSIIYRKKIRINRLVIGTLVQSAKCPVSAEKGHKIATATVFKFLSEVHAHILVIAAVLQARRTAAIIQRQRRHVPAISDGYRRILDKGCTRINLIVTIQKIIRCTVRIASGATHAVILFDPPVAVR
mmetsp:Transcript_57885/g.96019  ORF Transcript_57885/g.96019 Transcript_57885/m.96019 type:complete len:215 (-) Transcript_57885:413-1057(-)